MINDAPLMFLIDYRLAQYNKALYYDLPSYAHLCPYANLVWHRRLSDSGQFSVQVSAKDIAACGLTSSNDFGDVFNYLKFCAINLAPVLVGLSDQWDGAKSNTRFCDVGMIQAVEYDEDSQTAQLSGFFLDQIADGIVTTKRVEYGSGIALSTLASELIVPTTSAYWVRNTKHGLSGMPVNSVSATAAPSASETIYVDFGPTSVGKKLRLLCNHRNIGLRTRFYNSMSNQLLVVELVLFEGLDRSISQTQRESIVLADSLGSARSGKMSFDASGYSSRAYASGLDTTKSDGYNIVVAYSPYTTTTPSWNMGNFLTVVDETSSTATTPQESRELTDKMNDETRDEVNKRLPEFNVSIEAEPDCGYGTKFQLGDTITVRISGGMWDAAVTEVVETWKSNGYSLELVLGTERKSNIVKAVERSTAS